MEYKYLVGANDSNKLNDRNTITELFGLFAYSTYLPILCCLNFCFFDISFGFFHTYPMFVLALLRSVLKLMKSVLQW